MQLSASGVAHARCTSSAGPAAGRSPAFPMIAPAIFRRSIPRQAVVLRGCRIADKRWSYALRCIVELPAVFLCLRQRVGGKPSEHELEVARVERHAELGLRGKAEHVPRVLLGPSFQHGSVCRDGGKLPVLIEDPGQKPLVEPVVEFILVLHGSREDFRKPGVPDFPGNDEVVLEQDVALGFLRVGTEAEFLDLFDEKARDPQHVDVEDGVLGNRAVPHVEDDGLVRAAGLLDLLAGSSPELVDGRRVSADAGVGGRNGLGREVLRFGVGGLHFPDGFVIEIEAGKDDFQVRLFLLLQAKFITGFPAPVKPAFRRTECTRSRGCLAGIWGLRANLG